MGMILGKCTFPNSFLPYFQIICCRSHCNFLYEEILMCIYNLCFSINEIFTISFRRTNSKPFSFIKKK